MKKRTFVSVTALILGLASGISQARDIGPDEAFNLSTTGAITSFDKLNAVAMALHPGSTVQSTDLEKRLNRYIYQVELREPKGSKWEIELDAKTTEVLQNNVED